MNLTLGFIAFFIAIVIPGILFRRFFFYGEFSKQFNTKDPVLHSIFFSIIPGIVIQLACFTIYAATLGFEISFSDIFTIFRDFTSDNTQDTDLVTQNFINNDISAFFIYTVCVFIFSGLIGFALSRFIRIRKWDMKYKLFRFQNQWYYVFSGEVLNMKKFEDAHRFSSNKSKTFEQDTFMTYADILLSVSDDKKELYTGYVVDYDLMSDDTTQLDKIYLIDTHRYKRKEKRFDKDGNEIINPNEENTSKSRNRIKVPGDIFVLNARNIVNLNLTYVPSIKKKLEKERRRIAKKKNTIRAIQKTYLLTILLIILIHFFYRLLPIENPVLVKYFYEIGFAGKFITVILINMFLSFFITAKENTKEIKYSFQYILLKLSSFITWSLLFYFFVFKKLM